MYKSFEILKEDNSGVEEQIVKNFGEMKRYHWHEGFWGCFANILIAIAHNEDLPTEAKIGRNKIDFNISRKFYDQLLLDMGLWRQGDISILINIIIEIANGEVEKATLQSESTSIQALIVLVLHLDWLGKKRKNSYFLNLHNHRHSRFMSNSNFDPTSLITKFITDTGGVIQGANALRTAFFEFWKPIRFSFKKISLGTVIESNHTQGNQSMKILIESPEQMMYSESKEEVSVLNSDLMKQRHENKHILTELNRLRKENDNYRSFQLDLLAQNILDPFLSIEGNILEESDTWFEQDKHIFALIKHLQDFVSSPNTELFGTIGEIIEIQLPHSEYKLRGTMVYSRNKQQQYKIIKKGLKINGSVVFPAQVERQV